MQQEAFDQAHLVRAAGVVRSCVFFLFLQLSLGGDHWLRVVGGGGLFSFLCQE